MKSCWIFCGAPSENFNTFPPENSYIIAADSGYNVLKKIGITPDLILGDFDSYILELPDNCEIIKALPEKDDTDTMLAVKTALARGFNEIVIAASIGGRLDHTFANIQTLAYIVKNGANGCMIGENDKVYLLNEGEYVFDKIDEEYLSIFSFSETAIITTSGTKYNLTEYCLTNHFPLGVSNEFASEKCMLKIISGQILVIFSKKQSQL